MLIRPCATVLLGVATGANAACAAYLAILTGAGLRRPRAVADEAGDALGSATRFVILVPAHDEEPTIGRALLSFDELDYPSDHFAVHVVADNCTDGTADVVIRHGRDVHVRDDPRAPGKGPALNWLIGRLATAPFDVAVIVDADTSVDPRMLSAFDRAFRGGAVVAQANYSVRDHESSTNAALRQAALAARHHLRPLARNRLGGSAGLYGNGMAFDRAVLRRHPWTGHLTEDAELQLRLLIDDGIRVRYVPEARVAAEMPDDLDRATSQNERWERGRLDLVRTTLPRLLRELVGGPRPLRRAFADAIADQLVPPLSVHAASLLGTSALGALLCRGRSRSLLVAANLAGLVALLVHVVASLVSAGAPANVYRSLLGAPRLIVWKTALWSRALVARGDRAWLRTTRNVETVR